MISFCVRFFPCVRLCPLLDFQDRRSFFQSGEGKILIRKSILIESFHQCIHHTFSYSYITNHNYTTYLSQKAFVCVFEVSSFGSGLVHHLCDRNGENLMQLSHFLVSRLLGLFSFPFIVIYVMSSFILYHYPPKHFYSLVIIVNTTRSPFQRRAHVQYVR